MVYTSFESSAAVVIDSGSCTTKIGFAGLSEPDHIIPSVIGTKKSPTSRCSKDANNNIFEPMDAVVGIAADSAAKVTTTATINNNPSHDFNYIVRNGLIQDWDALECLWNFSVYDKLRCNPEEHFFVLTESPFNSPENREQMAEIMFETFNVPGLYIGVQPIFSLVASWSSSNCKRQDLSGIVVDSGHDITTIVPVSDGYVVRSGIQQVNFAGRHITAYIQDCLRRRNDNHDTNQNNRIPPSQSYDVAREIKEKHGYVSSNVDKEISKVKLDRSKYSRTLEGYAKNNGNDKACKWLCSIAEERFLAGELLFDPTKLLNSAKSNNTKSLPNLVDESIQRCPIDTRRMLYSNVVLSGGSTMFPAFDRRLQRDLKRITNSRLEQSRCCAARMTFSSDVDNRSAEDVAVNVVSHGAQDYAVWLGGSIIASDPSFTSWCHTREQYEEEGPGVARRGNDILGCAD